MMLYFNLFIQKYFKNANFEDTFSIESMFFLNIKIKLKAKTNFKFNNY